MDKSRYFKHKPEDAYTNLIFFGSIEGLYFELNQVYDLQDEQNHDQCIVKYYRAAICSIHTDSIFFPHWMLYSNMQ